MAQVKTGSQIDEACILKRMANLHTLMRSGRQQIAATLINQRIPSEGVKDVVALGSLNDLDRGRKVGMVTDTHDDHVVDAIRRELMRSPVTAGELMERTRFTEAPLVRRREALLAILAAGNALARVPLGMIVDETPIFDLALVPGETTARRVRRIIGPATRVEKISGAKLRTWVLHRREGPTPTHVPPYRLRENANPMRPTGLTMPFTSLAPGERLELQAEFSKGLLTTYRLTVET